jgi:hypothetical protein
VKGWKGANVRKENQHECHNELDWAAFCYLAGEMSPAETEQFEARLADEQPAREALARAVELTQVVAAAESTEHALVVPESNQSNWMTRLSWMAVGGLASAALAMLWSGGHFSAAPSAESEQIAAENTELAAFWAETREQLRTASEIGPLHPRTFASADADEDSTVAALAGDPAGNSFLMADAPSWMTAAVEGLASEMDQDKLGDEPLVN